MPDLRALADEDLIALVGAADAAAFEVLYDRHARPAFSLAYRMMGTRGAAEDVMQEAMLAVWRSGGRYRPSRGSVRTWILAIVHNRGIDALRRANVRERRVVADDGVADRVADPGSTEAEIVRRDEARGVRSALRTLPPDQERVIELAYFGGFTHTEISELIGVPLGTVKGRMRLGLEKMQLSLEATYQ